MHEQACSFCDRANVARGLAVFVELVCVWKGGLSGRGTGSA